MTLKHIKQILAEDINQPLITGFEAAFSFPQASELLCKTLDDNQHKEIKMTKLAKKRPKPYIWVTWLSSVMGEDKQCKYTAWFSAHYQFEKTTQ